MTTTTSSPSGPEGQAAELRRQIGDLVSVDCEPEGVFANDPASEGNLVRVEVPSGDSDDAQAVWLDARGPESLLVQLARKLIRRSDDATR